MVAPEVYKQHLTKCQIQNHQKLFLGQATKQFSVSTEKEKNLAIRAMMNKSQLYLYMMFYLSSISSAQMSLIECNCRPSALVVFTGSKLMTSPAKLVMHHAGVAVMLVCLKLEMKGLCMLKEIITICFWAEQVISVQS